MNYDHFAQTFSKSRIDHPWPELDYLIDIMKKNEVQSVLDIGCGNGRFVEQMKNSQFKIQNYLGIDNSSGMIEEARKLHPGYEFAVYDMVNIRAYSRHREEQSDVAIQVPGDSGALDCFLRRNDGQYDTILLLASFHHLETREDRLQVLRDMRKLLSPSGQIMMTNWNLRDQPRYAKSQRGNGNYAIKIGKYDRYYHGFTVDELEELFLEAGYQIIENRIYA